MEKSTKKDYSVPALDKAVLILHALAEQGWLSALELHAQLNIPKSTVFVLLNSLSRSRMVERHADGRYGLGHATFLLGMSYFRDLDIRRMARPHLESLVSQTPYTAHLAVLAGQQPVYIDKVEGSGFVRFATFIGQSLPLHLSGVGKALAAGMSREQVANALEEFPDMRDAEKSAQQLLEDVQFIRQHGFSIEDEQMEEGIRCIGSPVYDLSGNIVASISITSLSQDLPAIKFNSMGQKVREAAIHISQELGFKE
ncbi:IclR family transcriptional regulator [Paenibacillus sepulcri]|uniref:IclR family transcriptional regulator n=1 Tax=Paenibacillus sepulcri TaxID=359917 RepID=A0ABS7C7A6_9BACL|nr:IclR family transcriptional regulator [Paenibacillus sepulcri]